MHSFTRRERERAAAAIAERQARHDALVRPVLQELVVDGGGLATAVARLKSAGIPAPRPGAAWSRLAVWRICRRLGILLAVPGGLAEAASRAPRCLRCDREVRRLKLSRVCMRCEAERDRIEAQRELRKLALEDPDPLPRLGPGESSLQARRKPKHRHPRKRFGKPVDELRRHRQR